VALSLQDQLKKSGLVDEKKAKQLERAKRKESKQPPAEKNRPEKCETRGGAGAQKIAP